MGFCADGDAAVWGDVVIARRHVGSYYHIAVVTDDAIRSAQALLWDRLRVVAEGSTYFGFGEDDPFVLAGRLKAGALIGPDLSEIPPDKLFFAGGGGSVRVPSAFCGVFGHKPSYGIIPTLGYLDEPNGGTTEGDVNTFGPMARSAASKLPGDITVSPSSPIMPSFGAASRIAFT